MHLFTVVRPSFLLPLIFHLSSYSAIETQYGVSSPDKRISAYFWISDDRNACYQVKFLDTVILEQSRLGMIRGDEDFSSNLTLESASDLETIKTSYELLRRKCSYEGIRQVFHLKNSSGNRMDIIFQVSNDGVAFRYYFPDTSSGTKRIVEEVSSFPSRHKGLDSADGGR